MPAHFGRGQNRQGHARPFDLAGVMVQDRNQPARHRLVENHFEDGMRFHDAARQFLFKRGLEGKPVRNFTPPTTATAQNGAR